MKKEQKAESFKIAQVAATTIYESDPVAHFLIERLRLRTHTAALAGLAWSLIYLFALPTVFGCLRSRGGYLGSLEDWHAQLMLLLVFPATCAFYVWQPRAIADVYEVILSEDPSHDTGRLHGSRAWLCLSLFVVLAVVLFDVPKMIAQHGSLWMADNYLMIAIREASLGVAFYMVSMMAWRQLVATVEWNGLLARRTTAPALRAVTNYGLTCVFLLAIFGLRLSVEGIELPQRAGAITPDFYAKIAIYVLASLACFFAPVGVARQRALRIYPFWVITLLRLAGTMALPLLGFVVLKLIL
jgi:hypothetical protein